MTQQHTNNTNSNSQSEKPALESSEAGGQSEDQDIVTYGLVGVEAYPDGVFIECWRRVSA